MINDRHGGRWPGFLGRWSGRAVGLLCFGYAAVFDLQYATAFLAHR